MNSTLQIVKKYPFSCLCILTIWIICLIPVPETRLKHVAFIDKWTHMVMYAATCAVIWMEYHKLNWLRNTAQAATATATG